MEQLNSPGFQEMAKIIDPMAYSDSLVRSAQCPLFLIFQAKIPKYLIVSAGDEFFLPDSTREFWNDVPGHKFLRVVTNAEHSLAGQDYFVILQVAEFINRFINNTLPESLDYTLIRSNTTGTFSFFIS